MLYYYKYNTLYKNLTITFANIFAIFSESTLIFAHTRINFQNLFGTLLVSWKRRARLLYSSIQRHCIEYSFTPSLRFCFILYFKFFLNVNIGLRGYFLFNLFILHKKYQLLLREWIIPTFICLAIIYVIINRIYSVKIFEK